MAMKMRLKVKNILHRYNINVPRLRHRHKYTKYKMCLFEAQLKKSDAYKKQRVDLKYQNIIFLKKQF